MRFGRGSTNPHYTTPQHSGIEINDNIKDLGIYMSTSLKFDYHIKTIAAKGQKMAGWALRTFKTRNTRTMLTLLKSIIISQTEYCSPLWSPSDSYNINLLENVQKRFTSKFAKFQTYDMDLQMPICSVSYQERLQMLQLFSLQRRRERYIIMYMYKIIIHMVPNPGFKIEYKRNAFHVTPIQNLRTPAWIQTLRRNSFFVIDPRLYNKLPTHLKQLEDFHIPEKKHSDAFKRKLGRYLTTIPVIPGTLQNSLMKKKGKEIY